MVRPIRRFLRLALLGTLLAFYALIVLCFLNRWDQFVAITTIPIWVWSGLGAIISALAWPLLKGRLLLFSLTVWIITGIVWADETRGLLRGLFFPNPSATVEGGGLRVITIHCGRDSAFDADRIRDLQPDIVCLQNFRNEGQLPRFAHHWFEAEGDFVHSENCAILASGEFLDSRLDTLSASLSTTLRTTKGDQIELINVLLQRMPLRIEFWKPEVTRELMDIRIANRKTLRSLLNPYNRLRNPDIRLVAGSFGAPPSDDIFRLLRRDGYSDGFLEAGRGWGNTYSSRRPIVRIDQIWSSPRLKAVDSRTMTNEHSDHWTVIADFKFDRPTDLIASRKE